MALIPASPSSTEIIQSLNSETQTVSIPSSTTTIDTETPFKYKVDNDSSKEYMTLTPVKLKDLESPSRNIFGSSSKNDYSNIKSNSNLHLNSTEKLYKDKFNMISKQLEKLLENLNIVYQKIGYSNLEITQKEKLIFNTLSESIKRFYEQAECEMDQLSINNDIEEEILNILLDQLKDSSGIATIPDLYIRNAILAPTKKTVPQSPKRPLSLLNKKNSLQSARTFIFKSYIPRLKAFLNTAINFQRIASTLDNIESISGIDKQLISKIPTLEVLNQFQNVLNIYPGNIDEIYKFMKNNKKLLLYGEGFQNISEEYIKEILRTTDLYQKEYEARIAHIRLMIKEITKLAIELEMNTNKNIQLILEPYQHLKTEYIQVTQEKIVQLENILEELKLCQQSRVQQKKKLVSECQELWTKLKIPDQHIETFLKNNKGLSLKVIENFNVELSNLGVMKKKLIKKLIVDSFEKIKGHWETLQISQMEKDTFLHQFNSMKEKANSLADDEEILGVCENEISKLDEKLAIYAPVLKLIKEFQSLQEDKIFLEKSSKDSSRLLSRNSHKILLKEEKTRKRMTRHFPKVIKELKIKLKEAEELFDKPFVLNGQDLIDVVLEEETELISKYPRSMLDMGQSSTTKVDRNKRKEMSRGSKTNLSRTNTMIHKTPRGKSTISSNISTIKRSVNKSVNRSIKGTKSISPQRNITKILAPTLLIKNHSLKREPVFERAQSSTLQITPTFSMDLKESRMRLNGIRPTKLFPLNMNKLQNNYVSQIPTLTKTKSNLGESRIPRLSENDKENIENPFKLSQPKNSTPVHEQRLDNPIDLLHPENRNNTDTEKFSSPYKEPDHSIYKLSMSPDGKFKLNIQQEENQFDDTSILEDDEADPNFVHWKREQLANLQNIKQLQKENSILSQSLNN